MNNQDMLRVFRTLPSYAMDSLQKEYSSIPLTEEDRKLNRISKEYMRRVLNGESVSFNIVKDEFYKDKVHEKGNYKPFFSLFDDTPENVLLVLKTMSKEDCAKLYKKYDETLDNVENRYLSKEENDDINVRIVRNIRRRLEYLRNGYTVLSVNKLFFGYSTETILESSKRVGIYDKLRKLFGEDLSDYIIYKTDRVYGIIREEEKRMMMFHLLGGLGVPKKVKIMKSFFSLFLKYKRDDEGDLEFEEKIRNIVLTKLKDEEREYLYKKYGSDLNNVIYYGQCDIYSNNREIFSIIYSKIYQNLKRLYVDKELKRYKSLDERLKEGVTREEVIQEFANLSLKTRILLKLEFGPDYKSPSVIGTLTEREMDSVDQTVSRIQKRIIKKKGKKLAFKISKLFLKTREYIYLREIFGRNFALAFMMNSYLNSYLTTQEICDSLNISILEFAPKFEDYQVIKNGMKWKNPVRIKSKVLLNYLNN